MTRDLRLALRARRAGARHALKIVQEAKRAGIQPSWAFALVEQESGFRNVFGHDRGSILAGQPVTRARVRRLLAHVRQGGISNGVGLTQLTWPPFIRHAEAAGGAHKPRVQLRVGFTLFRQMSGGRFYTDAWRYNGARAYQAQITAKRHRWHRVLVG